MDFKKPLTSFLTTFLVDSVHSFTGSFYHSTHSGILLQELLSFILFIFLSKKTFQLTFMWLCKCKYICRYVSMQVFIYIVMFVLPTSQNLLCAYFNGSILAHTLDPDIVPQKKSLLGESLKFLNTIFKHHL